MIQNSKCCRSCPRCSDCPVLSIAATRAVQRRARTRSIVEEILGGPPVRELPPPVIAALTTLAGARDG
jgi:hypothetical protein